LLIDKSVATLGVSAPCRLRNAPRIIVNLPEILWISGLGHGKLDSAASKMLLPETSKKRAKNDADCRPIMLLTTHRVFNSRVSSNKYRADYAATFSSGSCRDLLGSPERPASRVARLLLLKRNHSRAAIGIPPLEGC